MSEVVSIDRTTLFALTRLLGSARLPLEEEKATQHAIANLFDANGIDYRREVEINRGDIIDFVVGDIGIEVKLAGRQREICRQVSRYAKAPSLTHLVLATNRPVAVDLGVIGKPVTVINLARGWL